MLPFCIAFPRLRLLTAAAVLAWLVAPLDDAFAQTPAHEPKMSWLDNGIVKLGVDLQLGGAITWLSKSGDNVNVVNSCDWGRQIQMSYYGGPVPFIVGEKRPKANWAGLGWNPIQVGDDFGNRAHILEHRNDGHSLYIKCIPMQWPLENVPGECTFESWLVLDGSSVHARCRLQNARADHTAYSARAQELPAVYTNAPWHRLISYTGSHPFSGEAVTEIGSKQPPWGQWDGTERWSALVDDHGWGLGVWNPDCIRFIGGFAGKPGTGGPKDSPCGYIAPTRAEVLDHNITHEYRYDLILGTVEEIRAHVYRQGRPALPAWKFSAGREGWYYERAVDAGWPIKGELAVSPTQADPAILSPRFVCQAEAAPILVVEAAFDMEAPHPQIFWSTLETPGFDGARSIRFDAVPGGRFHEYRVRLADSAEYRGAITQLRLDPSDAAGGTVLLRSVRFEKE